MFITALFHKSKSETTQMSINWWIYKLIVVYPCSGILFGNKKEWTADTCYNIDKPVKEATHKRPRIVWFHLYEMSWIGTENNLWLHEAGGGEWGVAVSFLSGKIILKLDCGDACALKVAEWYTLDGRNAVHGILQARVLEWVAIPFSRGSSWPRDRARVSCIAGIFFIVWATREAHI